MDVVNQVDLIREVFAYAHRFSGKTFVIHVDHGAVEDTRLGALVKDLVLLHQAGIRVVLVPGARQRIDEVLERYGVPWRREHGVRIATADAIPFIKMAAFDVTNRYLTLLSANNTNAVVGNWVRARGIGVIDGVDYEHAGVVERVQLDLLQATLNQGIIPLFPCIGWSAAGKPYNISSRELAYRIAVTLEADKLFFVTDSLGVDGRGFRLPAGVEAEADTYRISRMDVEEAGEFLALNAPAADASGTTAPTDAAQQHASSARVEFPSTELPISDRPSAAAPSTAAPSTAAPSGAPTPPSGYFDGRDDKLEMVRIAFEATRRTVDRVHIIDGRIDGVLLIEVFSNLGVGTMIHANVYQSIRPMRVEEAGDVHRLMLPLIESGVLIARSEEEIAARYADYVVHETDGRLHGCGALHEYAGGTAEIAAIAVDPAYEAFGIGRKIVQYLIQQARERGLQAVFALTTKTSDWFESLGFRRATVRELPEEKRRRYDTNRNSMILHYKL